MLPEVTIWKGGAFHTLESLGIVEPSLRIAECGAGSQADDQFVCRLAADVDAAETFADGERIEVWEGGIRRFVGWATPPVPSMEPAQERQTVTFLSATKTFFESTYKQPSVLRTGNTFSAPLQARVVLFKKFQLESGLPSPADVTLLEQVELILQYVSDYGDGGSAAPILWDTTGVPEINPEPVQMEGTCMQALEEALRACPSLCMRWVYEGAADSAPLLRFVRLDSIDTDTGAAIDPPRLYTPGLDSDPVEHTLRNDGTVFASFRAVPQHARRIKTLRLSYIYTTGTPGAAEGGGVTTPPGGDKEIVAFESTIENGSRRVVDKLIVRQSYIFDGATWAHAAAVPSANLARWLHMGFDRLYHDIEATTKGSNLRWQWRPGDVVIVPGCGATLAAARASITEVTRDLVTGVVTLRAGPPVFRGLGTMSVVRRTPPAPPSNADMGSAGYGTDEPMPPADPTPGDDPPFYARPDPEEEVVKIKAGAVDGYLGTSGMAGGVDLTIPYADLSHGDKLYITFPVAPDGAGLGGTISGSGSLGYATSLPGTSNTVAVLPLGLVAKSGADVSIYNPVTFGNITLKRTGTVGAWTDLWLQGITTSTP